MSEKLNSLDQARENLRVILDTDFLNSDPYFTIPINPPEKQLARYTSSTEIADRYYDTTCQALINDSYAYLNNVHSTQSMKDVIVEEVKYAYAHKDKIIKVFSPHELMIVENELGIFDPELVDDIEAKLFRGYISYLDDKYLINRKNIYGNTVKIVNKENNIDDLHKSVDLLVLWCIEYEDRYDEKDPFIVVDVDRLVDGIINRSGYSYDFVATQHYMKLFTRLKDIFD